MDSDRFAQRISEAIIRFKQQQYNTRLEITRYNKGFKLPEDYQTVEQVLLKENNELPINEEGFWRSVINHLARKGHARSGMAVLTWLQQNRTQELTLDVYNAALAAACVSFQYKQVKDILQDMVVKPDVLSYNLAINCLGQAGQLEDAFTVWQQMKDSGLKGNSFTCLSLIQACNYKRKGEYEKAIGVYKYFVSTSGLTLSQTTKLALVDVCLAAIHKSPLVEEASKILEELQSIDLDSYSSIYTKLIKKSAESRMCNYALWFFEMACDKKVSIDTDMYNALLEACKECGEGEQAFEVYEWMVQGKGCDGESVPVNAKTFNLLLQCCHQHGQLERGLEVLSWMSGCGVNLESDTCQETMDMLVLSKLWDDKAIKSSSLHSLVATPDSLRPAPFHGMRMLHLGDKVEQVQEMLLSEAKLGIKSWAPTCMQASPNTDSNGENDHDIVGVLKLDDIKTPLELAQKQISQYTAYRQLNPYIKQPNQTLEHATGYSMQGTTEWQKCSNTRRLGKF